MTLNKLAPQFSWNRFLQDLSTKELIYFSDCVSNNTYPTPDSIYYNNIMNIATFHGFAINKKFIFLRDYTPAPRLVGIETNPGPTPQQVKKELKKLISKRRNTTLKTKANRKPQRITNNLVKGGRFSTYGLKRFSNPPQRNDYLQALINPFYAPPPKLGFNTFVPTGKVASWFEQNTAGFGATVTGAVIMLQPGVYSNIFQAPFTAAQVNSTLNAITFSTGSMSNAAAINTVAESGRVINLAMRVKVRTAGTGLPGTLGFAYLPKESRGTITALTPNQLMSLSSYRPCIASDSGTIGGEVQYRPTDTTDFDFTYQYVTPGGMGSTIIAQNLVAIASGWAAATWDMEITVIEHLETLGGADISGDTDNEPDLVDGGFTIDSVSQIIATAGEPVITSLSILQKLDDIESNITRMRRTRSIGGMLGNFGNAVAPATTSSSTKEEEKYVKV